MMKQNEPASVAVFGTGEAVDPGVSVRVGEFDVRVADGQIRSVTHAGSEIARGITFFLRDADWATPLPRSDTSVTEDDGGTSTVRIDAVIEAPPIRFAYSMTISCDPAGGLCVTARGEALSDFQANRVGLTLLHPVPDCAGAAVTVAHSAAPAEETRFPLLIAPGQPVFDIRALTYRLSEKDDVSISFSSVRPDGSQQAFEMEDQRNWGDASYKTYVGSLREPWPFAVSRGDVFVQEIRIAVSPAWQSAPEMTAAASAAVTNREFRLPEIGIAVPAGGAEEALRNIRRWGCFSPGFVSCYVQTDALDPGELNALGRVVDTLGCRLSVELEVRGDPAQGLRSAARAFGAAGTDVHSILACPGAYLDSYQPDGDWPDVMPLETFYGLVGEQFPQARIGGGMLTYFTELNRKWPPAAPIDFIGHGYCPIVHAADDETVLQNLDSLPFIAATVADRMPGIPHEIISARLSMRQNPYGAAPQPNPDGKRIAMAIADPREKGQFGALWMIEVAERLATTQAAAVCLGALSGEASIFDAEAPGGLLPTYQAVDTLVRLVGADATEFQAAKASLVADRLAEAGAAFDEIRRR